MFGRCPGSPFVSNVFSTFCNLACISTMVSNLHPLILILILGKRKSQRAKSGMGEEYNCHVFGGQKLLHSQSGVPRHIVMMAHPCVHMPFIRPPPSLSHLRTLQSNFTLMV